MEMPERRESCGRGCERPMPDASSVKRQRPGMAFYPHDHELIGYLHRKLSGQPLPPRLPVIDLNVYKHTPQQLSELNGCGVREKEWYFFTTRDRKYKNGKRPNREAGDGFWKATGSNEEIVHDGQVIGWKRSLVYHHGKPQNGVKTGWIMHEFTAKDADYNDDDNRYNPNRTKGENGMQLDGYVICKIHLKRSKSELANRKEEGGETGQKKRKNMASTEGGRKAPHKDLGNRDFHTENSSPLPGLNDGAPITPWDQASIAELLSLCSSVPVPDQKQQPLQAAKEGTICFEHADTPDYTVVNAMPLDMFNLCETREQQQQTANHGAINYSPPEVPLDSEAWPPHMPFISSAPGQLQKATNQAVGIDFNPEKNLSDNSILNGANAVGGLSLDRLHSSAFPADFGDDRLDNESSLLRYFDYNDLEVTLDMNCTRDCTGHESCIGSRNF